MAEWLDIRTHEDHAAGQERILNSDTGETRVIPPDEWPEGLGPSSAVPLESMIEEMQCGLWPRPNGTWAAQKLELVRTGESPYEAVEALYAAWRERE